jgi:hypothetical protein
MPHLSQDGESRIAILAVREIFVYLPSDGQHDDSYERSFNHRAIRPLVTLTESES